MFDFFSMAETYEDRLVDNTNVGEAEVDTIEVTDSEQPYETGIEHPRYNDGKWVIVEMYDTKEEAVLGHKKWVSVFEDGKLPPHLEDVSTSGIKTLCRIFGADCNDVKELSAGN